MKTVKWGFIAFLLYLGSLFFRTERIPGDWLSPVFTRWLPDGCSLHVDWVGYGFRSGVFLRGVRFRVAEPLSMLISASSVELHPLRRELIIADLRCPRLHSGYYEPGNHERNARVECVFPNLPFFYLTLLRTDVLGVKAERVTAKVKCSEQVFELDDVRLDWPDRECQMSLEGEFRFDLWNQQITGSVEGTARQPNVRPFIEAVDIRSALPYIDAFTEVRGPVPAKCSWQVNLVNNDFDMDIELHPDLGKYNGVALKHADGNIHLHVYTRGDHLNYHQTFGPITGIGLKGEPLEGTVVVDGTNGMNTVSIEVKSLMAAADILKIGGFVGDYVGPEVAGDTLGRFEFRFPRAMTNNYEMMNGSGHIELRNAQAMRMKGFHGLIELLADKVPGFSILTDPTEATGDYVIENGVIKTDNFYIEGTVFSIKMYGSFDTVRENLDYTVRVQFTKKDSLVGKILHPLTWPFTKLLLEFRLSGSPDNPQWKYISVLDRVLEVAK